MHKLTLLLSVPLLLCACDGPAPPPAPPSAQDSIPVPPSVPGPMGRFAGLLGSWVDSTANPRFRSYEQWKSAGDSVMLGHGYVLKGKDTVFFEELKIEQVDGRLVYSARTDQQNNGDEVPFTALDGGTDSLVFENPGHDWPQCITYVKAANGTDWNVTVSGTESGRHRQEVFHYKRR
ncbi:MAG: DUF6265 family protein [Flavobacteriales bacterium]